MCRAHAHFDCFNLVLYCICMATITIPKELAKQDDLVVIPRKEYEALLELRKIREFMPSEAQKKALKRAESNFRLGKTLSYNELAKKLEFTS